MDAHIRTIEILEEGFSDWEKLGYQLAKLNPEVFVQMFEALGWQARVKQLLIDDMKVSAIKWCRQCTGWGLKEAKQYVDSVEQQMGLVK